MTNKCPISFRAIFCNAARQQLSIENKLLLYKAILKPIYVFMASNWGTASNSNIEILQRFQNKYLRIIINAAWYVTNDILHHDLDVPYVGDEIKKFSQRYADRMEKHPNILATNLMKELKQHTD